MAASTAAPVALVKGTTSLPVKRTRICTAVVLLPLAPPKAAGALAGPMLVLFAEAPGAKASHPAATLGAGAGVVAVAASVGLPSCLMPGLFLGAAAVTWEGTGTGAVAIALAWFLAV